MLTFTEADVLAWVTPLLWPFLRVVSLFSALPVRSSVQAHRQGKNYHDEANFFLAVE